jgi:hypothetical protein
MRNNPQRIALGFGISLVIISILACRSTPTPQPATVTPVPPPTEVFTPTFTPIPLFSVLSLVSNPTNEKGTSPNYTIEAQTPFFQGSEDMRVVNFNKAMEQLTREEIALFRDNVAQVVPMPEPAGSFFDQQFKVLSPEGNLVSIKFQIMIYIEGAAHPGTHTRTVNYDLEAGSDVTLDQLFRSDSGYLEKIANYCIAQLSTRDIGFEALSDGAQPRPENYGNWNITPEGLLVTFDEYQVAAYAAGAQEVVVPYSELKTAIDPNGRLGGFLP